MKELILLKVTTAKNAWFVIIGFLIWFKFQDYACNGCHDSKMLSVSLSDNAIITVKNINYCCIIQ